MQKEDCGLWTGLWTRLWSLIVEHIVLYMYTYLYDEPIMNFCPFKFSLTSIQLYTYSKTKQAVQIVNVCGES